MKRNIAIAGSILLVLSILVFFSACTQPGWIVLNQEQQYLYNYFIVGLTSQAQQEEIPAANIKSMMETTNKGLKPFKFKIVDKTPNTAVAKGSTANDLKKRFLPANIK
ncbi:hypothetical protein [Treponema sp.]|uniref:hypothetical protein n=1 Tax=Treponema sp. TaxID=166 RepID=UPI003FA20CC7